MIVVVCGPAGAGKTTVAALLQERLAERGRRFELLDSDQFSRNTYERLYERVEGSDADWIVAGTFYKRAWQARFERLAAVVFVSLEASLETCLERNRGRPDAVEEDAVHIIWREFVDPDAEVTVDVDERSPAEVVDRVLDALEPHLSAG